MKILTRLVLRILCPWGVFTSIGSLAGVYTNADNLGWYLWETSHPLFEMFKHIQQLALENNEYALAYRLLKEININNLALISNDDIAHYYNNVAYVAKLSKVATSDVKCYLREARLKALNEDLIKVIESNQSIVG
jgi:hypothetical protein